MTLTGPGSIAVQASDGSLSFQVSMLVQVNPPAGVIYPTVPNVLPDDLVTITRGGTTEKVAASVLKSYLSA